MLCREDKTIKSLNQIFLFTLVKFLDTTYTNEENL